MEGYIAAKPPEQRNSKYCNINFCEYSDYTCLGIIDYDNITSKNGFDKARLYNQSERNFFRLGVLKQSLENLD